MSILNLKYPEEGFESDLKERFELEFTNVKVGEIRHSDSGRYYNQYFIQFTPKNFPAGMHFEYYVQDWVGALAFHIEPNKNDEEQIKSYRKIGIRLMKQTANLGVVWQRRWNLPCGTCWLKEWEIYSIEQLIDRFRILSEIITPRLEELYSHHKEIKLVVGKNENHIDPLYFPLSVQGSPVSVRLISLVELMNMNLKLPPYQRDYCWEDVNITNLWRSLEKNYTR